MAIKYYLQPNPIMPGPTDQTARVAINKVHDVDSIIKLMLKRGSTVTQADIKAVLSVFFDVLCDEVTDGNSVNLPVVNIRPTITGVFANASDSFDPSRHTKRASLSSGKILFSRMNEAKVEKLTQSLPSPLLIAFTDVNSATINTMITPGGIGKIIGEELKFNPENPDEGIYFIAADGTTTKVNVIASLTKRKTVFSIPLLDNGEYKLQIRKGYGTTNIVIRDGSLTYPLHIP